TSSDCHPALFWDLLIGIVYVWWFDGAQVAQQTPTAEAAGPPGERRASVARSSRGVIKVKELPFDSLRGTTDHSIDLPRWKLLRWSSAGRGLRPSDYADGRLPQ